VAFLVNTKLVKTVPQSWADLLKPEYKNAIVYQDPRSTGQGQVVAFAAAFGNGGSMDNVAPGIDYLGKLTKAGNVLRTVGTTPYAQFLKGEIPIWIGYENDGLKAKFTDGLGDGVSVVIPKEASAAAPYAISLVKNGPNPNAGKLWLNFIMSDEGQKIFAEGYVRPAVPGVSPAAERCRQDAGRAAGLAPGPHGPSWRCSSRCRWRRCCPKPSARAAVPSAGCSATRCSWARCATRWAWAWRRARSRRWWAPASPSNWRASPKAGANG
jgi:ABC-type Fe3+ transport system substrate-binding protein